MTNENQESNHVILPGCFIVAWPSAFFVTPVMNQSDAFLHV